MIFNEIFAEIQIGFPVLSFLIFFPVIWAIGLNFMGDGEAMRKMAFVGMLFELVVACAVAVKFVPGVADMQFAERSDWMTTIGASYHLGVDGISVLFLPLTALLTLLVMLFSWSNVKFFSRFYFVNLLLLEAATMGIFASIDMLLFFVFWEMALVPSFFLIKFWGIGSQRQYAGMKYVVYMLFGSVPLLIGILMLGWNYHSVMATAGGTAYSFDFLALLSVPVPVEIQTTIFFLMAVGFAVKGPMLPFHTWMPSTLMEGPVGMGVFLVGLKLGVYGMIRFVIPLLPEAVKEWAWLFMVVGLIAVIYGALIALVQPNMRRLLAFASISHVGIAMVGMYSLNVQGIQGGIVALINMGLTATGLFFVAGLIYNRLGSTEVTACGGLTRHVPKMAALAFLLGLASIGMPGTSGFTGEFLIMLGAFKVEWQYAAVAVLGVILSAAYFLWHFERAFFGPVTSKLVPKMKDLNGREFSILGALVVCVFAIGLNPAPILDRTVGSVEAVVQRLNDGSVKSAEALKAYKAAQVEEAITVAKAPCCAEKTN